MQSFFDMISLGNNALLPADHLLLHGTHQGFFRCDKTARNPFSSFKKPVEAAYEDTILVLARNILTSCLTLSIRIDNMRHVAV